MCLPAEGEPGRKGALPRLGLGQGGDQTSVLREGLSEGNRDLLTTRLAWRLGCQRTLTIRGTEKGHSIQRPARTPLLPIKP